MGLRLLLALALACTSAASAAAPLWQNTESGMSVADVAKAQPQARPPSKVDTVHGGGKCELAIESFEISANRFKVCFYFRDGRLTQVMLNSDGGSMARFETMLDLLRAKYGPELGATSPRCKPDRFMTLCEADWLLKSGTNVSLLYLKVGTSDTDPVLNINYQTRMAAEASKL